MAMMVYSFFILPFSNSSPPSHGGGGGVAAFMSCSGM